MLQHLDPMHLSKSNTAQEMGMKYYFYAEPYFTFVLKVLSHVKIHSCLELQCIIFTMSKPRRFLLNTCFLCSDCEYFSHLSFLFLKVLESTSVEKFKLKNQKGIQTWPRHHARHTKLKNPRLLCLHISQLIGFCQKVDV